MQVVRSLRVQRQSYAPAASALLVHTLIRLYLFAMKLFLKSASFCSVHGHFAFAASFCIQKTKLRALLRRYGRAVTRCCKPDDTHTDQRKRWKSSN